MNTRITGRETVIIRTSLIGILTNLFLSGFKITLGLISKSIAIVLDGVNNLSDALSSVITIIGARMAGKAPDRKHPLGHGRIEYLSAMIVAAIVLYAGLSALIASVQAILEPETAEYTPASLVILGVAIAVKLILGRYVKKQGEKVKSGALIASGSDAMFDAILSASALGSALIYLASGISLEAWVGAVISVFILRDGIRILMETLDQILGSRADPETSRAVRDILNAEPEIRGTYDLILHNYGPNRNYASVHVELPDTMTVEEVDHLTRRVEAKVYRETGVILTGVGVYAYNTADNEAARMRNRIQKLVLKHEWALQLHGFDAHIDEKLIRFDVVLSFDIDPDKALEILHSEMKREYPDYLVQITPDVDVTD